LDVSIVFEYDMMCARVCRVKCYNFSNISIRIRTDFYIKIRIVECEFRLTPSHPYLMLLFMTYQC